MQKQMFILLLALILCVGLILPVSANGPTPAWDINCNLTALPEGAAYLDLLIQLPQDSRHYTAFNEGNGTGLGQDSEIARYRQEGYCSFTLHYEGAASQPALDAERLSARYAFVNSQYEYIRDNCPQIRFAVLDEAGNILLVSETGDINPAVGYFTGSSTLDVETGALDLFIYSSPLSAVGPLLAAGCFGLMGMLLSAGTETGIAWLLRLPRVRRVFLVNLATQLFLVMAMGMSALPYLWSLLLVEAIVYFVELAWLLYLYRQEPRRKIILFVLTANTVTLVGGLLLHARLGL